MLANILSRFWWTTLARGVIWILFGLVVLIRPGISLVSLSWLFGVLAFVDGVAGVLSAVGGRTENENWGVLLLAGLAGIGVGLLTFTHPGITALALLFYIAVWAISTGLLEVAAAIRLRREIEGEFWLVLAGLVSIAFGVFLMAHPGEGALAVLILIGSYAIGFGIILLALAFRARGFLREMTRVV